MTVDVTQDGGYHLAPSLRERMRSLGAATLALMRVPTFAVGATILIVLLATAAFAPLIAPYDPAATDPFNSLAGPSSSHLMGTDQLGRDVFSRVVHGARLSIQIAVIAVVVSTGIGTLLGLLTAYIGGAFDAIVMRLVDVQLAFPGLIFALVLVAVLGPGVRSVTIAVGISGIPTFARVTRGSVIALLSEDYVTAARSIGCRPRRIVFRHLLPNVIGTVIVLSTLWLAFAILIASSLSFLGIGVRPPTAEWGAMANDGRAMLTTAWWVALFPCLMIVLFVFSVNLIGDALRDRFDTTLRGSRTFGSVTRRKRARLSSSRAS